MRIKCFDVTDMVIQEAAERFKPIWIINEKYYTTLKSYCSIIDSLAEEFDGESYEVEVDEIKATISIKLECSDITLMSATHTFYSLARQTKAINFTNNPETGNLVVEFVFPSIWMKAA